MHQDALVHRIQPLVGLGRKISRSGFSGRLRFACVEGDFDFSVASRAPDRSGTPSVLLSIPLPRAFRSSWKAGMFSVVVVFVHAVSPPVRKGPCKKSDGHRFASFVILHPDDGLPPPVVPSPCASIRTRSSNSSGKVERKIACSGPQIPQPRPRERLVLPPRDRGHAHWNSNGFCRAEKIVQLLCAVLFVRCECQAVGFSHVAPRPAGQDHARSLGETHCSPQETQTSDDRDARWTPKDWKRAAVGKLQKW